MATSSSNHVEFSVVAATDYAVFEGGSESGTALLHLSDDHVDGSSIVPEAPASCEDFVVSKRENVQEASSTGPDCSPDEASGTKSTTEAVREDALPLTAEDSLCSMVDTDHVPFREVVDSAKMVESFAVVAGKNVGTLTTESMVVSETLRTSTAPTASDTSTVLESSIGLDESSTSEDPPIQAVTEKPINQQVFTDLRADLFAPEPTRAPSVLNDVAFAIIDSTDAESTYLADVHGDGSNVVNLTKMRFSSANQAKVAAGLVHGSELCQT